MQAVAELARVQNRSMPRSQAWIVMECLRQKPVTHVVGWRARNRYLGFELVWSKNSADAEQLTAICLGHTGLVRISAGAGMKSDNWEGRLG